MRLFVVAALTAFGLGLTVTSGSYATPINATSIATSASEIFPVMTARYRRNYHRHYRWSYGPDYYDRPYSYRPYSHGPYYYGTYHYQSFAPFFWW